MLLDISGEFYIDIEQLFKLLGLSVKLTSKNFSDFSKAFDNEADKVCQITLFKILLRIFFHTEYKNSELFYRAEMRKTK